MTVDDNQPGSQPGAMHHAGPFATEQEALAVPAVRAVYDTYRAGPGQGRMLAGNLAILRDACEMARVELGAYDVRILAWLAGFEPQACAVIAGLVTRARMAGEVAV